MSTSQESETSEGPLAHAARVASERSYLDGLADAQRDAWERASGARPERASKRLLVALSHSIEKAVLSGPVEHPTVVVALFQQLRFFDREREVYERMAAAGVIVVVGFAEGAPHQAPDGVHLVSLRPDESLAEEWSVVAVGPRAGAFLVATDQHAFDSSEREYEASRQFVGRWGYSHAQAGTELARLRFSLGDRLDVVVRGTIDDLLAGHMPAGGDPAASAGLPGETWATTSLGHMMDGMQTARAGTRELREQLADAQRAASARATATTDPHSGVSNPDFLKRWSHPSGANPLPIGLALFDVAELDSDAMRDDDRASYFAAHQVAAALTQPLGPVDAVVRMSAREFLVVVPGASSRHLAGLCDRIGEQLELASHGYPDISLRAGVATIVTRSRPLPVQDLHESLAHLDADEAGPVDAGRIPAGDDIIVSSTALHGPRRERSGRHDGPAGDGDPATDADARPGPVPAPPTTSVGSPSARTSTDGETPARETPDGEAPDGETSERETLDGEPARRSRDASGHEVSGRQEPGHQEPGRRESAAGDVPAAAPPRPRAAETPSTGARPGPGRSSGEVQDDPAPTGVPNRSASSGPEPAQRPSLPQRTAQEALRRLVYGEEQTGGDPRARADVFADLSDPRNGLGPRA